MRSLKFVAPVSLALTLGVGCAHTQAQTGPVTQNDQKNDDASTKQKPQLVASTKPAEQPTQIETQAQQELAAAVAALQNVKVFFSYDDATLTPEGQQRLGRIADILAKNARLSIRVEGNCDERGTEDYNIALGQRRAEAARRYLITMGAKDNQVATVSYGAERPVAQGHDESAWSQNRRDDIVVTNQN